MSSYSKYFHYSLEKATFSPITISDIQVTLDFQNFTQLHELEVHPHSSSSFALISFMEHLSHHFKNMQQHEWGRLRLHRIHFTREDNMSAKQDTRSSFSPMFNLYLIWKSTPPLYATLLGEIQSP